jgi:transcription initiation factor TFIID subunit 5
MSDGTPPADTSSSPEEVSPPNTGPQDPLQNASSTDRMVIEYLRARGHTSAEQALLDALDSGDTDEKGKGPETSTISTEELVKRLAVYAQKPSRPGENVLNDSGNVLQELTTMGNPTNIQNLIASIGAVGAEEILSLDPTDKQDGFTELEAWVDGSLDMYRVSQQLCCRIQIYRFMNSLNFDQSCFLYFAIFIWI